MADPVPTEKDYRAAREVLERDPSSAHTPADEQQAFIAKRKLELLAELHAMWGSSKFRLRYGLRPPRCRREQWGLELFRGQITKEQYKERAKALANRPIDSELLEEFFPQLEARVRQYSCALQAASEAVRKTYSPEERASHERSIGRYIKRTRAKFTLFSAELPTLNTFLEEARLEAGLGIAKIGEYSASNATFLAQLIMLRTDELWRSCRGVARRSQTEPRYESATTAAQLFAKLHLPILPAPQDILALLNQEQTAARVMLRKRQPTPTSDTVMRADNATIHVQAAQLNLDVDVLRETVAKETQSRTPLLRVQRWSDLGIGIDEHKMVWGVTPVPAIGTVFPIAKAVQLPLRGLQWAGVLKAFAESADGTHVDRFVLLKELDLLPPTSSSKPDGRAIPGAIEQAQTADLGRRRSAALAELNSVLAELRRRLRTVVTGPKDVVNRCMRTEGKQVNGGFVVRYLIRGEAERLLFGHPRRP